MSWQSNTVLTILLAGLMSAGCGGKKSSSVSIENEGRARFDLAAMRKVIEEKNDQFTKAHVTGGRATIDGMFTQDAKSLPPGADPVIGRAAIDEMTGQYLEFGVAEFREETTDFYGNEDLLIDQGNHFMVYGKDSAVEEGKYLNVWKKEDGHWKIHSNIWNTNAPSVSAE